jgi:metal transporter CNNM
LLKASRFGDFLRSTLSWWRSATISASREVRDLKSPMTIHQISPERTPSDSFLQQLDASGRKWVIFVDDSGSPHMVLDVHHFLRDVLFNEVSVSPEPYWHRPIVITGMSARLGDVIGLPKMKPEHPEDDVIDHDLILVWGKQKRIITGADLLGRLLRGITTREVRQN